MYQDLEGQPSPRVFTTHSHYDSIPRSFFENKVKTLLVLRNPKDNAVSFYHFSNANPVLPSYDSWDSFYRAYMDEKVCFGSYFDYLFAWNKHIDDSNIMAVTFEGLKEDFPSKVKQIAEFFGKPMTDKQIALAGSKTTFKSMKKGYSESHGDISSMIFRKGDIGDWKNYFTEEQSQEMNAKFEERLAGTKLGDMINYKKYCTY
uniref:Sulfotransferase n=1 Tax=Leptobrachium leishanense TaxID=445787 RepID=A0A8C5QMF0_9ANUR